MIKINRSLVFSFLFCFCFSSLLVAQEPLQENSEKVQRQFDQINVKLEAKNKELSQKKRLKQSAESELSIFIRDLRKSEVTLKNTRRKLSRAQRSYKKAESELAALESSFNQKTEEFKDRLVAVYKQQPMSLIDFVFSPENYADVEAASYFFERILKKDVALIESLSKDYATLKSRRKSFQSQVNNLSSLRKKLVGQERSLKKKYSKKEKLVAQLDKEIKRLDEENRILQESSERLAKMLRKVGAGKDIYYGSAGFIKPVKAWISSKFGYRTHPIFKRRILHRGIDFAAPKGRRIKAADSGIVIVAGEYPAYRGYGKVTVINHGRRPSDGKQISTLYAHQSRILVKEGDFVTKGDEIGWVGSTGFSTGPHLHFEVWENGKQINPMKYFR